jgi:hypothetical protein
MRTKYVYGYDKSGVRSGPRFYKESPTAEGVLDHSLEFEYEENKVRHSLQRQLDENGTLQFTQYFSYNDEGERVAICWKSPKHETFRTYRFSYSVLGGLLVRTLHSIRTGNRFDYFDMQLTSELMMISLRFNRWAFPSLSVQYKYAEDQPGNHIKAITARFYPFMRIIPIVPVVFLEKQIVYFDDSRLV